jgi:hypothetical protein
MRKRKRRFYETLARAHDESPSYDIKIVLGDLNAQIGNEEYYSPVIGKKSLHEVTNDNGDWLIQFALSHCIISRSTFICK